MTTDPAIEDFLSREALLRLPLALVITDPHIEDNPIVYVNEAFERMTGYSRDMAIGRNCRFLQGDRTDEADRDAIRKAMEQNETATVDIYNYRADGEGFWNRLILGPVADDTGAIRYFFGIQNDMSQIRDEARISRHADRVLREVQHRVKNHLSMIVAMIRLQAKEPNPARSYDALATRVEALQTLYQEMTVSGVSSVDSDTVKVGAYISRVASAIGHLDGRRAIRLNVDCDDLDMDADRAGRLGLLVSEFLTNAFKHAFRGRDEGLIELSMKRQDDGRIRLRVADDGRGLHPESKWRQLDTPASEGGETRAATDRKISDGARSGLGVSIARSLIRSLRAEIVLNSDATGTRIELLIPA